MQYLTPREGLRLFAENEINNYYMTKDKTDLLRRVNETIDHLRPYLQSDGGDIEVLEITDENIVKVRFQGACSGCQFSEQTFKAGVEQAIRKNIPEIREVISV